MKLSDIQIETRTVHLDDKQSFEVRGLNLSDLLAMTYEHAPEFRKLFDQFMEDWDEDKKFTPAEVKKVLMGAIKDFPELVFKAIACACDEPESWPVVKRLPLTVQLDAIEQICLLSLKSDAELKKLQEMALRLIQGTTGLFQKMSLGGVPSINGYGKSARA